MSSYNMQQQEYELKTTAPTLMAVLEAAAVNPHIQKNNQKTKESLMPMILTSASILLNCRSQHMNAHQVINSLTLKEGAAKKSTFKRLNTKGVTTSYYTALSKQIEFGEKYDEEVKEWAKAVQEASVKERELEQMGDAQALDIFNCSRQDEGYQLVMDNVDIVIQARHPTRDNYGKDLHMVQMLAVQHRVTAHHLSNSQPIATINSIDSVDFLPNANDNKRLRRDWMIIAARVIAEHIPSLKVMMSALPSEIAHEHMREMNFRSKVVNLGVLMENENTTEGIIKIMHHMHSYTPGHDSQHPTTILSAGDLLTCEREGNCIEQQRNSSAPSQRLEGLMPVISDFHALANFYQVMWKHLYDASSAGDKGTLYSARNYLEARNVTTNPMKNINAASDLLEKFTTALVTAAAMHYFGIDDLCAEPTKNVFNLVEHGYYKQYAEKIMASFVDKYMLPTDAEIRLDEQVWHCSMCNKTYKSRKSLIKHEKSFHSETGASRSNVPSQDVQVSQDSVLNYTRCALGMGMVALDFTDARQMGDGARIIRLYKLMLLHCKAGKKPKYSYQILRLLAQVKCFLTPRLAYELVWNRCINTKGKAKCNVETDRVMEHHNRIFKEQCRGLRGKLTQKSVNRISRSAQRVHEVLTNVDRQLEVKRPSAKRQQTGKKDVASLARELHQEHLFQEYAGRKHSKFPDFPVTVLSVLEVPELHRWISAVLQTLSRQNQFTIH